MPVYNYLPGVIVNTLDGGLVAPAAPQDDSILILATAGQGPINTPVAVTDRTTSFNTFGAKGTLSRSVEECATYSDNITVLRIGAKSMELQNVGTDTTVGSATPGFSITLQRRRLGDGFDDYVPSPETAKNTPHAPGRKNRPHPQSSPLHRGPKCRRPSPRNVQNPLSRAGPGRSPEATCGAVRRARTGSKIISVGPSSFWHRKPHQGRGKWLFPTSYWDFYEGAAPGRPKSDGR